MAVLIMGTPIELKVPTDVPRIIEKNMVDKNDKTRKCFKVIKFNATVTIWLIVPDKYQDGSKKLTRNRIISTILVL
jgi:hypothetical protein